MLDLILGRPSALAARAQDKPGATSASATATVRLFRGYAPTVRQRALFDSRARFLVVCAGRRSGKTYGAARAFMARIMRDLATARAQVELGERGAWQQPARLGRHVKPFLHYWCVAPTYDLTSAQQREIFDILGVPYTLEHGETGEVETVAVPDATASPLVLKYDGQLLHLWLVDGVLIEFRSAEHPDRLVSSGLHGLWVDEAARMKARAWIDNLEPTLQDQRGWAMFTTTPLGKNWFYSELWDRTQQGENPQPGYEAYHFTTADNTAIPHLAEEMELARGRLADAMWRRNYAADFNSFEGKIYEDFIDQAPHIVDVTPSHFAAIVAGMDWGFSSSTGCLVVLGIDDKGCVWVLREYYIPSLTVAPPKHDPNSPCWVNIMLDEQEKLGCGMIYADPAGAEHIATCRANGVKIQPAFNSVETGIDLVAALLRVSYKEGHATTGLRIARRCKVVRKQLASYRAENGQPVKVDDHACDAVRYGVATHNRVKPGALRVLDGLSIYKRLS